MMPVPHSVVDKDTWFLLEELDELGEGLTQWEIDFVEELKQDLLMGMRPIQRRKDKLDEIREERLS